MIWLLNKLGIIQGVYLMDFEGDIYRSFVRKNPFGGRAAYVYPWAGIHMVALLDGGVVKSSNGQDTYVKSWVKMP